MTQAENDLSEMCQMQIKEIVEGREELSDMRNQRNEAWANRDRVWCQHDSALLALRVIIGTIEMRHGFRPGCVVDGQEILAIAKKALEEAKQ